VSEPCGETRVGSVHKSRRRFRDLLTGAVKDLRDGSFATRFDRAHRAYFLRGGTVAVLLGRLRKSKEKLTHT
jgi:hypothetical protein